MSEKISQLCSRYGLKPSRRYGQNFLLDEAVLDKIIEAAELSKSDTVVEIGPGFGALTFKLAEKAGRVLAFEIEKKIKPFWDDVLSHPARPASPELQRGEGGAKGGRENVEIIWGDALVSLRATKGRSNPDGLRESFPWFNGIASPAFAGVNYPRNDTAYKVVANLPYQITSPIIRAFLEADNPPELMVLTVQKEVAERICAQPGDMSILSVAVQYYAKPEIVAIVPRTAFWPVPEVDSAVVKIDNRQQKTDNRVKNEEFFKIVKAGFANRRKLLIKNLAQLVSCCHPERSETQPRDPLTQSLRDSLPATPASGLAWRAGSTRPDARSGLGRNDKSSGGKNNPEVLKQAFAKIGLKETVRAQELSVEQWQKLADCLGPGQFN